MRYFFTFLFTLFFVPVAFAKFPSVIPPVKADELVIQGDGAVVLILTNNQVLGESTPKQEKKTESAPVKTVTLAPANVQSVVSINPKPTDDKKIEVKVTVNVPVKTPKPTAAPTVTAPVVTKKVDSVVAQNANGQEVLVIKPNKSGQITINQDKIEAQTALPLQIDTATHSLESNATKISVLPKEAVSGAHTEIGASVNRISLDLDTRGNGLVYNVSGNETGKLLGILPVQSTTKVTLSAKNGRIIQTSQSPLFSFFRFLIR